MLAFLVALATAYRGLPLLFAALLLMLAGAIGWARLPVSGAFARAALVLPFTSVFALIAWWAGDPVRGLSLVAKSYLSALAVLLVVSTTPLPCLLRGFELAGAPSFLLLVVQFLYRYLFVIASEAQHMSKAAAARGASSRKWLAGGWQFRAAAGALAVLFARSYRRAEQIQRAMLARGFRGRFQPIDALHFGRSDAAFAIVASLAPVLLRIAAERAAR